jgi:hypothetical protein
MYYDQKFGWIKTPFSLNLVVAGLEFNVTVQNVNEFEEAWSEMLSHHWEEFKMDCYKMGVQQWRHITCSGVRIFSIEIFYFLKLKLWAEIRGDNLRSKNTQLFTCVDSKS